MKLIEVSKINQTLTGQLVEIWGKSVRETHLFLSDTEIKSIEKYIPQALDSISHLIIAVDDENKPVAFMGLKKENWKCFLFPQKIETKAWENNFYNLVLKNTS